MPQGASAVLDPEAFSASTPLPKRKLEGVFAGFVLQILVSGCSEEYLGGLKLDNEPKLEEKQELMKEIYKMVGEMYTDECEAKGLKAPENITSIPVARELMNPAYFAAYSFAVNTVAWNMLKDKGVFQRFRDRIGGRVFDAVSQYVQFKPNNDMEDIKGMRKSLTKFLEQYAKLGLAAEATVAFPKGMDKKWKNGDAVKFTISVEAPILREVTDRMRPVTEGFQDWLFYIIQRMFTAYLVDAELVKEYTSEGDPHTIIQEWVIEQM